MSPAIIPGDKILVNKLAYGPRFFSLRKPVRHGDISRLGSTLGVERNDVVVFNFPFPKGWRHLRFDVDRYYVKRCLALPGDTISIIDGRYRISGLRDTIGNMAAQMLVSRMTRDSLRAERYGIAMRSFPRDRHLNWTVRNFGPLYVPCKGDTVTLSHDTFLFYGKLIGWELGADIEERDGRFFLHDSAEVSSHVFHQNYYFMGGDKCTVSQDSRYWGLVPEEFIAGKAVRVWWSRDKATDELRFSRFGNYAMMGDAIAADSCFLRAHHMVPNRLYPLFLLARLHKDDEQGPRYAALVLNNEPKVMNPAVRKMRRQIRQLYKECINND